MYQISGYLTRGISLDLSQSYILKKSRRA